MKILISNSTSLPIYEQIKNQVIDQILSDDLKEGQQLPSIRALSKEIRISVMTVKKAYDELETEGYIETRQGKGSFVSTKSQELAKDMKQQEIETYIFKVVDLARAYGIPQEEIFQLLELAYRSE
ncbi:MAG: GntR family transcriptional regulator [Bacillota bacterium]|nr:GntR family transcriptional regulator [Bacillota bacterium]